MDLSDLLMADFDKLNALATGDWQNVTAKLTAAGNDATSRVGGKIRGHDWDGFSGLAAKAKADDMEKQLDAAVTEASAIKWLLWKAAGDLRPIQQQLKPLVQQVDEHRLLEWADRERGEVEIAPPTRAELVDGSQAYRQRQAAIKLGMELRGKIRELLKRATERDVQIAKALLATTNVDDDPKNPDFNPDAGKEGYPDFDDSPLGQAAFYKSVLGAFAKELTDGDPPAEQSAKLGARARELAEQAGGMCKTYDGMMVCVNAPSYMYRHGGTTYGDTFISPYQSFDELAAAHPPGEKHGLIDHEKYHRDEQWRKHGYGFGRKYLTADERPSGVRGTETGPDGEPGPKINEYEWGAEHHGGDGGYPGGYPD